MSATEQAELSAEERQRRMLELDASQSATKAGIHTSAEKTASKKQNPEFLDSVQDVGIDSEKYSWVENELGVQMADGHTISERSEEFARERKLLAIAEGEIMLTERTPGRLLKQDKRRLAAVQHRVTSPQDKDFRAVPTQEERRAVREGMDLAVARQVLGVKGRLLDAMTKITTETQTRKSEDEEQHGLVSRAKGILR